MSSHTTTAQSNILITLAPTFVCLVVSAILYGISCLQTFIYFSQWRNNRPAVKAMVGVVTLFNTLQLIFCLHGQYTQLILNFGNPQAGTMRSWQLVTLTLFSSINDFIVRSFFARRIVILSKPSATHKWFWVAVAILIVLLSLLASALTNYYAIRIFIIRSAPFTQASLAKIIALKDILYTFNSSSAAADIIIAIGLCTLLARSQSGFKRTNSFLHLVMSISLSNGVLTSLVAMSIVVAFAIQPEAFYALGLRYILSQLHINCLLVVLNARVMFGGPQSVLSSNELSTAPRSEFFRKPQATQDTVSFALDDMSKRRPEDSKVVDIKIHQHTEEAKFVVA